MSEIPAPQDPEQPSPAPAAPPEPPTPPPAQSKLDWRLVVVICLAVLFLIAIYANKKWISKPPAEPAPQESASREGPAPSGPALTPTQRYALMLHVREMEIQGEMFTVVENLPRGDARCPGRSERERAGLRRDDSGNPVRCHEIG